MQVISPHARLSLVSAPSTGMLPSGFSQFNFVAFKVHPERASLAEARATCQAYGSEFDLAAIHDIFEQQFIFKLAGESASKPLWIGLQRSSETNGFSTWLDGTALNFAFWAGGEPNDLGQGEDCVRMGHSNNKLGVNGEWFDTSCASVNKAGFVCAGPSKQVRRCA